MTDTKPVLPQRIPGEAIGNDVHFGQLGALDRAVLDWLADELSHVGKRRNPMPKFRKKPVEIEAVRWTGDNTREVCLFLGYMDRNEANQVVISTLEGAMRADVGDWIIRGVAGEFYPCKPNIFDATYEPVSP